MGLFDFLKGKNNEPEVENEGLFEEIAEEVSETIEEIKEEVSKVIEEVREEIAEEIEEVEEESYIEPEKKKGFFGRLIEGLGKTRKSILSGVDSVLGGFSSIDEDLFEELEEVLIMADIGVNTTVEIVDRLRKRVRKEGTKDPKEIKRMLMRGRIDSIVRFASSSLQSAAR